MHILENQLTLAAFASRVTQLLTEFYRNNASFIFLTKIVICWVNFQNQKVYNSEWIAFSKTKTYCKACCLQMVKNAKMLTVIIHQTLLYVYSRAFKRTKQK